MCRREDVRLPSYPDGPRPSTVVELAGAGRRGRGEHVGWTAAAHAAFADAVAIVPRGRSRVGDWPRLLATVPAYDRAALEAAAIDLALRQRGTSLAVLAGVVPRPIRYVVSFGPVADPAAEASAHGGAELKVDVDPRWGDATFAALAATGRVAVLDWKGRGVRADHLRAHHAMPEAWLEDPAPGDGPWPRAAAARLSVDAALAAPGDLDGLPFRPAAANLKPARMGGVLALLDVASRCAAGGIAVYLGGMFEIGVGRRQLHSLAALLCPDGPNDVAPIPRTGVGAELPARLVAPDGPGFGV